jgi:hypothetical protein
MRIVRILAAALLIGVLGAKAQTPGTAPSVIQDRTYKLLREDEDWSFLRDRSLREDFWDHIKYIPLRKSADDWYMTIAAKPARSGSRSETTTGASLLIGTGTSMKGTCPISTCIMASMSVPSSN